MHCIRLGGSFYLGRHFVAHLPLQGFKFRVPAGVDESCLLDFLGFVFYCFGLLVDCCSIPFDTFDVYVGLLQSNLHQASFSFQIYLSSTRISLGAIDIIQDQDLRLHLGSLANPVNFSS